MCVLTLSECPDSVSGLDVLEVLDGSWFDMRLSCVVVSCL